jgi:dihydropteroate synthase type 2
MITRASGLVRPTIFGILNMTEDSFSDGGRYLASEAALEHARVLVGEGADVLDIGAAASNPDAKPVPSDVEIARLAPIVAALKADSIPVSVDSFSPEVQRWAIGEEVEYLNDVRGFSHPDLYPALAASATKLIVMHSVQSGDRLVPVDISPDDIFDRCRCFFEGRIGALVGAGISETRLVLDPGMGLFLGSNPEASFTMLRRIFDLKQSFGLPVLISVSRKSFLRRLIGRSPEQAGAASLAAELFAAQQGADGIRTHEPRPLRDALTVWRACAHETDRNVP